MKAFLEETMDAIPDNILDSSITNMPPDFENDTFLESQKFLPPVYVPEEQKMIFA